MDEKVIKKKMKKRIKKHPFLKQYVEIGIKEYNLTEDEAIDIMIETYFNIRGIKWVKDFLIIMMGLKGI